MSEMLVAQCPHCQTRFRLSQEHLQAAAGNVRCGACLKVFNASLQLGTGASASQPEQSTTLAPPTSPTDAPLRAAQPGPFLIHDDLELDELDLEALGLDESLLDEINPDARAMAANRREPATRNLSSDASSASEPETEPEHEAEITGVPDTQDPALGDESVDAAEDLNSPSDEPRLSAMPTDAGDALGYWDPSDDELSRAFDFDEREKPRRSNASDEWNLDFNLDSDLDASTPDLDKTDPLLDDIELHDDFRSAARARDFEPLPTVSREDDPEIDSDNRLFGAYLSDPIRPRKPAERDNGIFLRDRPMPLAAGDDDDDSDRLRIHSAAPASAPAPVRTARREPSLGDAIHLPDLVDEPLYLDDRPLPRRSRSRQWLWGLLSLMAALALLAQALTYNFAALAHDARTRPVLEQICLLTDCELPARVDISLIRSSNLVVRPHPDFPNALAVDVILYNRADFAQPFPVLRMTFSDRNGREVANKTFRPAEYLAGELAGESLMPPQTPVHVGLSLLDPGSTADSYQLDFLSP